MTKLISVVIPDPTQGSDPKTKRICIGEPVNQCYEVAIGTDIVITHGDNQFLLENHKKGLSLIKANSGAHRNDKLRP